MDACYWLPRLGRLPLCVIESTEGGVCTVDFAAPQWAVTPGQSVVIYESRVCLGGGIIR